MATIATKTPETTVYGYFSNPLGEHFENNKLKNMKTTNESIIASVNREAMKELLDETKETLAPEFLKEKRSNHSFSVVDLWMMQKNS